MRTHTDYGNSIRYPITKKNKQSVENLQCCATKIVPEIENLPTLVYCSRRGDLIQMFKILHGIDDIDSAKFVT